jgi:O-acetyl-ADP-ribose deacetylase (regulator of RNase III)
MRVEIKQGDVLKEPGDVLVCSANVYLNLSGGVGGEILRRHGDAMQRSLHRYLREHQLNFVPRGEVIDTTGNGTHFQHVLHAVAVDAWYCSSVDVIADVLKKAFRRSADLGARKVVVAALATGYGRLSMHDFGLGLRESVKDVYAPLATISVVVQREDQMQDIRDVLDEVG